MKKVLLALILVLSLGGCASTEYKMYLKSQETIEMARYTAEGEKYKALGLVANSGDSTAKVAAVMALALGNSQTSSTTKVQAPQSGSALQWASVLVPGLTQVAGFRYNYMTLSEQSKNNASVAISTNNTFAGIASNIPSSIVTTTTTTDNSQVLSGTGNLGTGTYSVVDNHELSTPIVPPVVQIVPIVSAP